MFFSSKQDYTLTSRAETTQHITTDVLTNLAFLSIVYCMACVVAYRNRGNEQLRGLLKWMATFAAYLYVGACVFPYLEQYAEINERRRVRHLLRAVRANLTESVFDEIADAIAGPDWESKTTGSLSWTFDGAVFFSFTLMTTIGYGSFVPQTRDGRLFTICYAPIGIAIAALTYVRLAETLLSLVEDLAFALMRVDPLKLAFDDCDVDHSGALSREEMAAMLTDLGAELSLAQFKELMASAQRHGPEKSRHGPGLAPPGSSPGLTVGATPPGELAELISYEGFAHALTLRPDLKKRVLNRSLRAYRWVFCFGTFGLMLALCATVGMWQEGWSLVDSFYFAVITFTTIGLGDFTPTIRDFATWGIWFYLVALGVTALLVAALLDIVPAVVGAVRKTVMPGRFSLPTLSCFDSLQVPLATNGPAFSASCCLPPPAATSADASPRGSRAQSRRQSGVHLSVPSTSAKAVIATATPAASAPAVAPRPGGAREEAHEGQRGGEYSKSQML